MNFQTEHNSSSDEYRYVSGLGYIKLEDFKRMRER